MDETFESEATKLNPVAAAATETVSAAATRAILDDVATRLREGDDVGEEFHAASTKLLDVDSEESGDRKKAVPKKAVPNGFHAAKTKLFGDEDE